MRQYLHHRKCCKLLQLESDHVAADSMSVITCARRVVGDGIKFLHNIPSSERQRQKKVSETPAHFCSHDEMAAAVSPNSIMRGEDRGPPIP